MLVCSETGLAEKNLSVRGDVFEPDLFVNYSVGVCSLNEHECRYSCIMDSVARAFYRRYSDSLEM